MPPGRPRFGERDVNGPKEGRKQPAQNEPLPEVIENFETPSALARAAGIPIATVSKWRRLPEWSELVWPCSVDALREWMERHGLRSGKADTSGRDERTRLAAARAAKLELERAILAGRYVRRADVERGRVARVVAVRARLLALPLLAGELAGLAAGEIETRLTREVETMLAEFAGEAPVVAGGGA